MSTYGVYGVAVDASGNVYVSDEGNQRVLLETNSGGNYTQSVFVAPNVYYGGLSFDAAQNLFAADFDGNIDKIPHGSNTPSVLLTVTSISGDVPQDVVLDSSGNVYVTQDGGSPTAEVDKETFLGAGSYSQTTLLTPADAFGVALDANGNVYATDSGGHVYKETYVSGTTYTLSTFSNAIAYPYGIAFDATGNLFVTDGDTVGKIYKFTNTGGGVLSAPTIVLQSNLSYPYYIAFDAADNIYIADNANGRVVKFQQQQAGFPTTQVGATSTTTISVVFTFGSTTTGVTASLVTQGLTGQDFADAGTGTCSTNTSSHTYTSGQTCTVDVTFHPKAVGNRFGAVWLKSAGNVIATGYTSGLGVAGQPTFSPATQVTVSTGFSNPQGLVIDGNGKLFVADTANNQVVKGTGVGGGYSQVVVDSAVSEPYAVAVDGAGNLYVADHSNNRIKMETWNGTTYTASILPFTGLSLPDGVAVDAAGNVYIADTGNNRVLKETLGASGYTQSLVGAGWSSPTDVQVDANGNVYVLDTGNNQVVLETFAAGAYTPTTVATGFDSPQKMAVDQAGNIYIADKLNNQIVKETVSGGVYVPSVLATTGLTDPSGVAVDAAGNVFIAGSSTDVIELDGFDAPALAFASTSVNDTSAAQTVTVTNTGNAPLSFPIPSSGNDPSISTNFSLASGGGDCPLIASTAGAAGSLAAGASCTLPVSFAPTTSGSLSGTLVLTDAALNAAGPGYATQTLALSGTATVQIAAKLGLSGVAPGVLPGGNLGTVQVDVEDSVGNVVLASSASVTVTLTGPGGYSQSSTQSAASGVATFNLSSDTLSTPGAYTFTASSASLTSATATVIVSGAATQIAVTGLPTTLAAGGNPGTETATIEDAGGNVAGSIAAVTETITGPGSFSQTSTVNAVAGVATFNLSSVVFALPGTYTVTTTSSGLTTAVKTIAVTLAPGAGVNFGSVPVGTTISAATVTLTLPAGGTIGAPVVVIQGAAGLDFTDAGTGTCTTNGTGHSYSSGDTCTVDVAFTPRAPGSRYGAVVLQSSGVVVATGYVFGIGVGPVLNFLPAAESTVGTTVLYPSAVAADANGNVYISRGPSAYILKETLSGSTYTESTIGSGISDGDGIAVDGAGNVYISSYSNGQVLKETWSAGSYTQSTVTASGLGRPGGVAVDGSGNIYISDTSNNRVLKESMLGVQTLVGSGLSYPAGLAVDTSGNLYIADQGNNRVLKETLSGSTYTQTTVAGSLNDDQGVAVDPEGNVYIADSVNNRVLKETLSNGSYTQSSVSTSSLNIDQGIAVDGLGNLYIADTDHSRVLKEDLADASHVNFASVVVGSTSSDSPKTVSVVNAGNAALTFPIPSSGNDPSISANFTLGAGTCPVVASSAGSPGTLASQAKCTLPISFTPAVTGSLTGTLVLTDTALNAAGPSYATQTVTLSGISVSPAATQLAISGVPVSLFSGGNLGTVAAQVENVLGNVVTSSSASVTVTITGPASYSVASTLTAASGVASFNLAADTLTTPGTYTVTATSSGLTNAVATAIVTGPPAQVAAAGLPTALTVGSGPGTETASIEDASGNIVVGSTAAITETITGPGSFLQTSTLNATAGTATFHLSAVVFTMPGTYVVATTSSGLTTATANIVVSPVGVATASFGSLPVGTASSAMTLTFTYPAGGTLALPSVVTQGITGLDFVDAGSGTCTTNGASHVYAPGATCTVAVTFTPGAPGLRAGAVVLLDGNGHAVATGYLSGVGSAGLAGFDAGTIQTLAMTLPGSGGSYVNGITVDAAGNLYLVDADRCLVDKYPAGGGAMTILVGNGSCATPVTTGIGSPATQVRLASPWRVALNGRGDLFVSDTNSAVVLKVDAVTQITTIYAGALGVHSHTADGALAAGSAINAPYALAVDGAGNLYFTDEANNIVQRVDAVTGIMSTAAGTYDTTGAYGGDGGPATNASVHFNAPLALALDSGGNLYISDTNNNLIRKLILNTGVISRFAGQYHSPSTCTSTGDDTGDNGPATSADLCDPEGIAVDGGGNLYIADSKNRLVRKVNAATGTITVAAGKFSGADAYTGDGGAANMAGLSYDEDVTVDGGGNFYIADSDNGVTRKVTPATGVVSFSSFDLGVSSPAGDVTLTNSGNAALHVSSLATTTNFNTSGADTTCSSATVLAPGAECVLGIEFLPTVAGSPLTGTVTLIDDANNVPASTQTVALSGTGVAGPKLALTTPPPSSVLAGGNLGAVTVSVESFGGVLNGSSTASVTLTITGPGGYSQTVTQTAVGGLANFNLATYTIPAIGTYTVTATSSGITPAAATVTVAGAATQLAVTGLPATLVSGGNLGTPLAHIEDVNGNPVTTSTASVTVTITGPGGYSQVVTQAAVSGVAALNLSALVLTTPGIYTVTTTSTGLSTSVFSVTVTVSLTQLALAGVPASVVSGGNLGTLTVTEEDANGNPVLSSTAAVTVTITGPGGFTHAATAAAAAGVAGFNLGGLAFTTPGTYTVTVTVTGNGVRAATATFTVTAVVTTVAIASSNLAPNYGASVTLTATVAPAPKDSPAGTVNFYSGAGLGRAGTLLGTSAVGAGGVATLTIALPLGQDTLTTVYSGSADFAPSASAALPVSNRAVTTLNFSVAPTTQLFNNPIVLTAQVASAAPESATGTVTFLDGTAVIATAAVGTAGIAAASESTLADGQHNLTATYSGDSTFQPGASSGAGISITISDLDLALGGDNNQTVLPGAAVTYNFPLSPLVTPTFLYEVTLTANGLPPGATYTFSPASIPAGSGPLGVAFTVQTAKPVALGRPGERGRTWYALALGMLLPLAAAKRFRKRLRSGVILLVALSLGGAAGLGGCGSGGFLGTPVGKTSYTITIVASSADLVRTSTVQLNFK